MTPEASYSTKFTGNPAIDVPAAAIVAVALLVVALIVGRGEGASSRALGMASVGILIFVVVLVVEVA
jgi:hypothetical protein